MAKVKGKEFITVVVSCLGVLLTGAAGTTAHADSVRSQQWHLDAMRADEMWKTSTGKGVTVAVIDSGVDPNLPDLRGQVLDGEDFSGYGGDEHDDYYGHGTIMAAIIAGSGEGPESKAVGLAPDAKILPLRVPQGKTAKTEAHRTERFARTVGSAIRHAADSEAKVINISLATELPVPEQRELAAAVKYADSKGALIFAGVGNDGKERNPVLYPAALPGVVGVAATDRDGKATRESQSGPQVDLAAPGDETVAACRERGGWCVSHGTSDATALASASAALIWAKYPDWTANQVLRVMINTASGAKSGKKRTDYIGYGIVRPRIALSNPGDPGPADVYPIPGELEPVAAEPGSPGERGGTGEPQAAGEAAGGGDTALWIGLGLGAAALIGGGVGAAVVVSRRRRVAGAAGVRPPVGMPHQQQHPHAYPRVQQAAWQTPQQSHGSPAPANPANPANPGGESGVGGAPPGAPPGASSPPSAGAPYPPGAGGGRGPQPGV
ncbi:type VII secretion-associated serine protease mycosin [Streptomyces sp. F63]|uniref:type VII secretion-associated serine protease mycosin n=1 Tax=Streptomyces sp. F63 TaxID=2824887 RepID=UPI001B397CCD|nr:type VII secretion-associated serine protease mycosin [Streptomyces sp. F63]MBQ0988424.1 type VII secretion-associated serine protease mycosin [Streptomyces sp. F63]